MQTILKILFFTPRGEELEPDNNPPAPLLQQPESLAIGRLTQPLRPASASRGQQEEEVVGRP
jgi:hypothetical protein